MKTYTYVCRLTNSMSFTLKADSRAEADKLAERNLLSAEMAGDITLPGLHTFEVLVTD